MGWKLLRPILVAVSLFGFSFGPGQAQSVSGTGGLAPATIDPPPGFTDSCARYAWLCTAQHHKGALAGAALLALAESVNDQVNRGTAQITDIENFGVAEYWSLPVGGRGDCEDLALAKYKSLLDAGVDSRDLAVAVVLDHNRRNHAVLVLRHESGDLVLDSLTSRILPWNRTGYTFLAMQADEDKSAWRPVMGQSPTSLVLAQR